MNSQKLIFSRQEFLLILLIIIVYISGLFLPVMENDSAQHATMAMRMSNTNDFLHLYKGDNPYLDKPHMHFWLAGLSFKVFGISEWAYRLPSLLILFLGAFSTKKLVDILYPKEKIGNLAGIIFLTAQTIVLSGHDVRTDSVLTGFTIFAIWQIVQFLESQNKNYLILAGLGSAVAFGAKGFLAVVVIGLAIFSHLLYNRKWTSFFNPKIIFLPLSFVIGITPILYAYYIQFGEEGIRFILWEQNFNRLTATGFEETSPDYFFFFHTILWAFLPFSIVLYLGLFHKISFLFKNKFKYIAGYEFLSIGGFWLILLLISFSKFKLPHYLNSIIPIMSIVVVSYFLYLKKNKNPKIERFLYFLHCFISVLTIVVYPLSIWSLGINNFSALIFLGLICCVGILLCQPDKFNRSIFLPLWSMLALNFFLNTQFYPSLLQYQSGMNLAKYVERNYIDKSKIYMHPSNEYWSFDFYTQRNTPRVSEEKLKPNDYLIINEEWLGHLNRNYQIITSEKHFRVTRLSLKFLNPKTRAEQLSTNYLIKIID